MSNKVITKKAQWKKPTVSRHTRNKRSKRIGSNFSHSTERENPQQARKKRRNKTQLSMAEAIVLSAQILDKRERDAAKLKNERQREMTRLNDQRERERDHAKDAQEIQKLQFQAEMRRRDQHHELEMLRQQAILNQSQAVIDQGRERLLRLRANFQRQFNQTLTPSHRVLSGERPNSDIINNREFQTRDFLNFGNSEMRKSIQRTFSGR